MAKLLLGLKVLGRENLKLVGGKIIAANHTSNFDPIILSLATKDEVCFLAKDELFKFRKWFSWLIRTWNALPVRRGAVDPGIFKTCSELLRKNKTVILFPEGTRNFIKANNNLLPFKPGVGFLAVTNQVPVIPCYIEGVADSFIAKIVDSDINSSKLKIADFFSTRITIRFGNPIRPDGLKRKRSDYEKFTWETQSAVARLAKWE